MTLSIVPDWHPIGQAAEAPEDAATATYLQVRLGQTCLTEYEDVSTGEGGVAPYLAAAPLAAWIAWNWWRLRWEPWYDGAFKNPSWRAAHNTRAAGDGFIWPNITFGCEGPRVMVRAKPTQPTASRPVKYTQDYAGAIPTKAFDEAIRKFLSETRDQLDNKKIKDSEFIGIHDELQAELQDPDACVYRRFEALLGYSPDDGPENTISNLIAEIDTYGDNDVTELAGLFVGSDEVTDLAQLREIARRLGYEGAPKDMIRLRNDSHLPEYGVGPAWRRGVEAARQVRKEGLGNDSDPIEDRKLAEMAGLPQAALGDDAPGYTKFAYMLSPSDNQQAFVHRSKWRAGKRFDISRMIGDCVAVDESANLRAAAPGVLTYRQQMQKAFAAELLAPIKAVEEFLDGDYDDDAQKAAADRFGVSPWAMEALLKNNRIIERSDNDIEYMKDG